MTYAGHVRAILVLGLPLIGGHLAQMAIGLTDTVMIGWYSAEALATITLAATMFFVLFLFGSGFAWAVMPLVASANAEGDEQRLRRVTRMGIWLSVLAGCLATPLLWWSAPVLRLLGQTPELAAEAQGYLRIAGWGMIPALIVMVMKSYLAALERTQIVLWITILAALVNAAANYALIFGNWGAPELGLRGAAIASVTVQAVTLAGVVIYALRVLPEHDLFRRMWRPDWEVFALVFRLGLPIGLTTLAEVGLFSATAVMMGWLGTVPLAAHGVALQLASVTFMVHLGLSNAATVRAGTAYGRRDAVHLARGGRAVTAMSLVFAALTIAILLAIPEPLVRLFLDPTDPAAPAIIEAGVALVMIAALFQLVDGAQVIALGLLRGVQDTGVPLVMAAVSYWVVGIPMSYLLGFHWGFGAVGIWLGLVVGLTLAGVMLSARFWLRATRLVERAGPSGVSALS